MANVCLFIKEYSCNIRYVIIKSNKTLYKTKWKQYKLMSLVNKEPNDLFAGYVTKRRAARVWMCLYCMLHAMCCVGWGFPRPHCLFLNGSVWGGHPSRPSAALPVWQQQCLRASTAALSSPAPLSVPLPWPLCGSHPPNRVWLCPSSTDCVRMTASGLSGASPSMTCPKRLIKTKTDD